MIRIKIDHIEIQAREGTSVLDAARQAGIIIPSMCYLNGYANHPSCMVCLVKDNVSGNLVPSCSLKVTPGMDLTANDEEVLAARRQALELLLSDHVGDCEAPCSLACPAGMNIPLMNRLIAEGKFTEALGVVKEDIALPHILGYVCPAPCEKACRRKQIDEAVSVCLLKRFSAVSGVDERALSSANKQAASGKKVAIIGAGPAGLAACYYLLLKGHSCEVFEKSPEAGGTLRYSIEEKELPREVINHDVEIIRSMGAVFHFDFTVTEEIFRDRIRNQHDAVILATGDINVENHLKQVVKISKSGYLVDEKNLSASLPGIFSCGSAIRPHKMAVRSVAQGKTAALAVHDFLRGQQYEKPGKMFNSRFEKLLESEQEEYLKECSASKRVHPQAESAGFSEDEAVREAQRCMHCDCRKQDNCKLRNYADEYHIDRKRYMVGDRRAMTRQIQHDLIVYEPEKCIKCGLCVDISNQEGEKFGLAFEGRGFDVAIKGSLGVSLGESLSHAAVMCANACPTGAMSLKDTNYGLYKQPDQL
jgi:ferredoxin